MIHTVVSAELPVGEKLEIRKNVIAGAEPGPRVCIVTGTHGDELEGQFVCFELARRLNAQPEKLRGTVEIYPALNPLGIDSIIRGFPGFDLDMNRIFPGVQDGHLVENTAYKILEDLDGADLVLDIHSSNIFLRESMQARLSEEYAAVLMPLAALLNLDFIWINDAITVLKATLAHSLNSRGVKTIVVEMGIGMRITRDYGERLVTGIFNLLRSLKMWDGAAEKITRPLRSSDGAVYFINAEHSGVIIPTAEQSSWIKKGALLCQIVSPFEGKILEDVLTPTDGYLFTMRTYPVVYEGSLIARIFQPNDEAKL